ncbi:MAG: hypothetical protein GW859_05395 [Sphingomonadales bacterium]|nr:hypothetical protein [Sphingomonadales bacterium]
MSGLDLETARLSAFQAVRDCGVIRTRFDHPGLASLFEDGLVDYRRVAGDQNALDWQITPEGAAECRGLAA